MAKKKCALEGKKMPMERKTVKLNDYNMEKGISAGPFRWTGHFCLKPILRVRGIGMCIPYADASIQNI